MPKTPTKKSKAAQDMVAMRNKKLTPARRKEIATKAAKTRWGTKKKASA
jgi:hypothetical protein